MRRIHRILLPMDDGVVDAVRHVRARVRSAKDPGGIGLVFGEQQWDCARAEEVVVVQGLLEERVGVVRVDHPVPRTLDSLEDWL
jgi:hypothetical protein